MPLIPAASREWDGLVVLCAANGYDGIRMSDWHLAEHLSRLGPVLFVDPPISRLSPVRNRDAAGALGHPRLRLQGPGLARLTPVVQPFPCRPRPARWPPPGWACGRGAGPGFPRWCTRPRAARARRG